MAARKVASAAGSTRRSAAAPEVNGKPASTAPAKAGRARRSEASETASSIERAVDVLMAFASARGDTLGVTEIAETTGLSKAVVHRILSSFRSRDFVELDERTHRYRLGFNLMLLGLSHLDGLDVRSLARQTLRDLVAATNETATLSVRVGWSRVYIDQVTPDRDVKMVVALGRHFPLYAGASSKSLLAFLPEEEQEAYFRTVALTPLTPRTVTDLARLRSELAAVREQGFAISFGERDASAGSIAAPVFRHDGSIAGVVSVAGPVDRFSSEVSHFERVLLEHTRALSARLGYLAADTAARPPS